MDYISQSLTEVTSTEWPHSDQGMIHLGRVISITGSQMITLLDDQVCGAGSQFELRKGALIKMISNNCTVFGIVIGLSIPVPDPQQNVEEILLCELDLVGEAPLDGSSGFRRGVSLPPALGEIIYAATDDDLGLVYQSNTPDMLRIGTVYQADNRASMISTDGLLGKHFTIVGTTGSGKSCAVALILQRLLEANNKAHILLLDPHSEYSTAFEGKAEILTPQNLDLPYWLLNADEISEVISGGRYNGEFVSEGLTILKDFIPFARRKYFKSSSRDASDSFITVDTPIPYTMAEITRLIDEQLSKLEKSVPPGPYKWLKGRIETLRSDSRYSFMFGGMAVRDTMAEILGRLFRIPVADKPITIVDLSGLPSEVLNVVVSVLSRMSFDFALWSKGTVPILLVCEEAHRYAPADSALGFEPTKDALARIAKEGRKYGVSLAIITQRPSEIAPTILSQCNTVIAFRMTSVKDQDIIRGIVTDSAFGLLDFLPSLGNGEAIIAGEAVTVPQRVRMDMLEDNCRPRSATASFSKAWSKESSDLNSLAVVVDRWRRQIR